MNKELTFRIISSALVVVAFAIGALELFGGVASGSPATFVIGVLTLGFGVVAVTQAVPYRAEVAIGLLLLAAALIAIGGLLFDAFGDPGISLIYFGLYVIFAGVWGWVDLSIRGDS
jgi:hypothetical protein